MPEKRIPLKSQAGINPEPDSTEEDTAFWIEGDNIRFYRGKPQTIGGHVKASLSQALTGVPRTVLSFRVGGVEWTIVGTHTRLYAISGTTATNITPLQTSGTTLANNPLTMTNGSNVVSVAHTAHGMSSGDRIGISGVGGAVRGIPQAELEAEHIVTVTSANAYTFPTTANASSSGTGGGASVVEKQQIAAGSQSAAALGGWAGGTWVNFNWGSEPSLGTYTRPRAWSFDLFGTTLIVCPGNKGKIYSWDPTAANATNTAPAVITNAPTQANYIFVEDAKLFVLGAYSTIDGNQKDNRIANSDVGDYTAWTPSETSDAYEDIKEDAAYLMSRLRVGNENLIFDEIGKIFRLRWVGGTDKVFWEPISDSHQLIGPNARIEIGGIGYFMTTDNFHYYNGGTIGVIPGNTLLRSVFDDLNTLQGYKCTLWYNPDFQELNFHYPSAGATENDSCAIYNIGERCWYPRTINRTAAEQNGHPLGLPLALDSSGYLYQHETGYNNDTAAMAVRIRMYFSPAGDGDHMTHIQGLAPDMIITGTVSADLLVKTEPEDMEIVAGTLSITSSSKALYFDPAKTARLWSWEFRQTELNGFFRLGHLAEILTGGPKF